MAKAYFAGGCFWCITPTFRNTDGVRTVRSGYSGGTEAAPSYEDVKHQRTGHRETVALDYDESVVSYDALLEIFLNGVDPFDEGGQFIDRGHSYTLAVYCTTEAERDAALRHIAALEAESGQKAFVSVEPFRGFYEAEEYHQDYDLKNPEAFERELIESGRKRAPRIDYPLLCKQLHALIDGVPHLIANLANASALLYEVLPDLNWAGFYLLEGDTLVLGPFQGKTACIEIPVGKGVCGTAVAEDRTQLVKDVHLFPGHIACDSASNSEIVVPLRAKGKIVGVLDIDSPLLGRFDEADRSGLEAFAEVLQAALWG